MGKVYVITVIIPQRSEVWKRHCLIWNDKPGHSGLWTSTFYELSSGMRLEIKYTINIMFLNHPKTNPPLLVHGKNIVFHKISP